jgi:protein-S-isoprenylcysteine O-methyltransferase Ste14
LGADNTRVRNLPALVVGLLMAFYWARVLRLAWKQKRRTGQAGNLLPPERLGRVLRVVWFPVIGLWVALPIWAGVSRARIWLLAPLVDVGWWGWVALVVAAGAFVATWVCWRKMGRSWRMGIDPRDRTKLVITGPFAYLRHPIYSLSSLLMICTMAILPSPAMLVVGVIHLGLLQWEARREERYLLSVHGEAYAGYAARTGRFWPRLRRV